jgi:hypothetical protein
MRRLVLTAALLAAAPLGATLAAQAPVAGSPRVGSPTGQPAASATAAAAAPQTGPVEVDRVVAIVGSAPILHSELIEEIIVRRSGGLEVPADSAGRAKLERECLPR